LIGQAGLCKEADAKAKEPESTKQVHEKKAEVNKSPKEMKDHEKAIDPCAIRPDAPGCRSDGDKASTPK
jgi:hypothetical protein